MAAYWYLICADRLDIDISQEDFEKKEQAGEELLPAAFTKDFELLEREEYIRELSLPGGNKMQIPKIGFSFTLKKVHFEKYKSFLIDAFGIIKDFTRNSLYEPYLKDMDSFIDGPFASLVITQDTINSIDQELARIEDNYYLRYWSIPRICVYHGWPPELESRSIQYSLRGFNLFQSRDKMGIIPMELVFITDLQRKIQETLASRYEQAQHLYILGF